jgi:septin 7
VVTYDQWHDRLKQIDVEFMRRLHDKVNLIPVIAKADSMTEDELREFKARVSTYSVPLLIDFLNLPRFS